MEIQKYYSDSDDKSYIDFRVIHDDGSEGGVDLRVMELEEGHHMEFHLQDEEIPLNSKVAETFFYPHSKTSLRRKGIGSKVLSFVLDKAKKEGIKVVYGETTDINVLSFFHKNGFKGDTYFYKII